MALLLSDVRLYDVLCTSMLAKKLNFGCKAKHKHDNVPSNDQTESFTAFQPIGDESKYGILSM